MAEPGTMTRLFAELRRRRVFRVVVAYTHSRRTMQSVATDDPEAHDDYLRGRRSMDSMEKRDYEHAIRMFEQAIAVDSKHAQACAGRADACSHRYRYVSATPENLAKANLASEQAVIPDPECSDLDPLHDDPRFHAILDRAH